MSSNASKSCGEGQLRTLKYENQKSCFFLCLESRFSEQNGEIQPEKVTRKIAGKKVCTINLLHFLAERGGLYCSFFRNSLVFCHFVRKTRIFCRFRPSLSSRIRLSSALQSLLWTSKVPKKSNMSNKSGFLFWVYFHCRGLECGKSSANFPGVADRIASLGTLPAPSTLACRATRVQITASSNIQTTWLA